jgi:predicted membrane-bound mannosyltransferase
VLFFTSFLTHEKGLLQGPLDSIRTYVPWVTRAGGESPHVHPWFFYFERLFWWQHGEGPVFTELLVAVLAVVGLVAAFTRRGLAAGSCTAFVRFLAIYTLILMTLYTVISYKTPWCLLGWYHGVLLLAGVGVAALWQWLRPVWAKAVLAVVLLVGVAHLSQQACRVAFTYAAEPANPWVYAHTSRDLLRLIERVQGVAVHHPDPARMVVKVAAPGGDYWPLPWYLRNLPNVGYYAAVPEDPFADAVIMGSRISLPLDDMSEKEWIMAGYYQLRPKVFLSFYPKFAVWKDYVESLPPPDEEEE